MGSLTLAPGPSLVSGSYAPDCTFTSTVPEPEGTPTETCESLSTLTAGAAFAPKNTERCPAAPEKFLPVILSELPAGPLLALNPLTKGVRSTNSKLAAVSERRVKTSFMFQTNWSWLVALPEAEEPVTYMELPMSARIRPYCCMARAIIWACGPILVIKLLTVGVFIRRKRAPNGTFPDRFTICEAG